MNYNNSPLVSIGVPTYNRSDYLHQAIESVLNQDYNNIELIISDNASTDNTNAICIAYEQKDNRVRYFRQPNNIGPVNNFLSTFNSSNGEFFMWLADDDLIDLNYISSCMEIFAQDSRAVLVCGIGKLHIERDILRDDSIINLLEDSKYFRVIKYLFIVRSNSCFYGVIKSESIKKANFKNNLVGDWLFVASLAFQGRIYTLNETAIHRSCAGAGCNYKSIASVLGLPAYTTYVPMAYIFIQIFNDIYQLNPVFSSVPRFRRFVFALVAAFTRFAVLVSLWIIGVIKNVVSITLNLVFGRRRAVLIKRFMWRISSHVNK